jgi:chorismate synthase
MSANSFGTHFHITSFGESHGEGLGVVVEGCPSGVQWQSDILVSNLKRRAPGGSALVTSRKEPDAPEILSGVFKGKTLGTPICMVVKNTNQRSEDYKAIKDNPRVGHADDLWHKKFDHVDHRGGGRASGRETLSRVLGGSVAQMFVSQICPGIQLKVYPSEIFNLQFENYDEYENSCDLNGLLIKAKKIGESYGGKVQAKINGLPSALGQPVFSKFKSDMAAAMMSIGSTCGFEVGAGISAIKEKGTDFHNKDAQQVYGGLRGGITSGETLDFKVAFKPPSSVLDVAKKGRHDPCVVLRALPVVEAMSWLVIADHLLWQRLDKA